jgi:sortase A
MMKRLTRTLGTLMILAGLGMLGWALLVWQWQDPFTALYTRYEQRHLASSFDERLAEFRPIDPKPRVSLAAERRQVALEARRYRRESRPREAIGRIKIKRLGLSIIVVNGTAAGALQKGPGRDLRTYMPGEGKLVYVAGHRTTYLAPFSHIDSMRVGDEVTFQLPYATFVYRVTSHVIVPATDLARLRSHGREVLALQACHPRFFASHRYIVYARPVQVIPRGGEAYAPKRSAAAAGS